MNCSVGCVVIPTYGDFLDVLAERQDKFTALIWPGHKAKANRMVSPYNWFSAGPRKPDQGKPSPEKAVPFLYRGISSEEAKPPYEITHVSLAVYMVHWDAYHANKTMQETLTALRVEKFCETPEWGDVGVKTWYVVSGTFRLDIPIPYEQLHLIKQDRDLASNFTRGYGLVWLPECLQEWYNNCYKKYADLLTVPNIERWRIFQVGQK